MSDYIGRRTNPTYAPDNTRDQPRGDWLLDALCAETDVDTFHPPKGGDPTLAKKVCALCPVRPECLTDIMRIEATGAAWGHREGVYGGLTGGERGVLARSGWEATDGVPGIRWARGGPREQQTDPDAQRAKDRERKRLARAATGRRGAA